MKYYETYTIIFRLLRYTVNKREKTKGTFILFLYILVIIVNFIEFF